MDTPQEEFAIHAGGSLRTRRTGQRGLRLFVGTPSTGEWEYPLWVEASQTCLVPSGGRKVELWFASVLSVESGAIPDGDDPQASVSVTLGGAEVAGIRRAAVLPYVRGGRLGSRVGRSWVDNLFQYWVFGWERLESPGLPEGRPVTVSVRAVSGRKGERFGQECYAFLDDVRWTR